MKRRRAFTTTELVFIFTPQVIMVAVFIPTYIGARHNARRSTCQSNLKRISLAFLQYAEDNDERLPEHSWVKPLAVYAKTDEIFQCPETYATKRTTDYFWNARFFGRDVYKIKSISTLILAGDGRDDAPLDASLTRLPMAWRHDEDSPAWRHLEKANYAFADGHIKSLNASAVSVDFRWSP